MAKWDSHVKIKHLMTENEDLESVQKSMREIADVLKASGEFYGLNLEKFYTIPQGDGVISPVDYANKLIDRMYDYADDHRIWIE